MLAAIAEPDAEGRALLTRAAERLGLSARALHRTLRVARTLADLDGSDAVRRLHRNASLAPRGDPVVLDFSKLEPIPFRRSVPLVR